MSDVEDVATLIDRLADEALLRLEERVLIEEAWHEARIAERAA